MLNNITIGQYFPANSVVHRLDPRVKLVLTLAYLILLFLAGNAVSMGLCAAALIACIALTRIPVRLYLRTLKAIWFILALTGLLNLFYTQGDALVTFWVFTITRQGVSRAVFMIVRIVLLIAASSALTYTTSPTELTDAIERLLSPLKLIHLGAQVHTLAMMMSIALRFIPTLLEETDKITSAQKARGADLESGGILRRIRAMLPILIPLLISASRRAYELAEAMECRCYHGGSGRTKMKQLRLAGRDFAALGLTLALAAAVIVLRIIPI